MIFMVAGQKSAYEYHLKYKEKLTEEDKAKNRQYGIEYYMKHRKSNKPYRPRKKYNRITDNVT